MDFESLRFIRHFQIVNCDNEDELVADEARMQACEFAGHQCQLTRGGILTYAVETERLIERICSLYFVPRDLQLRERFQQIVLEPEFCSFSAKLKMLKSIADVLELRKDCPSKSSLKDLMETRNKFAHGKIIVDWKTTKASIRHYKDDLDANTLADTFCEKYLSSRKELVKFITAVRVKCGAIEGDELNLNETNTDRND